jgi:hypothetical protein
LNTFDATEFGDPVPGCNGSLGRGVWYKVMTPGNNVRIDINTCGSDFGTVLSVYTNGCGSLSNALAYNGAAVCADRSNPFGCGVSPGQAGVSFSAVSNTTYYILVGGSSGTGGNLKIRADIVTPPPNDTCANPTLLVSGETNSLNTFDATEFGDPVPGCNGSFGRGVWYMFTSPAGARLTISTCGSDFPTVLAVSSISRQ